MDKRDRTVSSRSSNFTQQTARNGPQISIARILIASIVFSVVVSALILANCFASELMTSLSVLIGWKPAGSCYTMNLVPNLAMGAISGALAYYLTEFV